MPSESYVTVKTSDIKYERGFFFLEWEEIRGELQVYFIYWWHCQRNFFSSFAARGHFIAIFDSLRELLIYRFCFREDSYNNYSRPIKRVLYQFNLTKYKFWTFFLVQHLCKECFSLNLTIEVKSKDIYEFYIYI